VAYEEKANEGNIWRNKWKKEGEKSPDFFSDIEVDGALMSKLADMHRAGNPMKLRVALWRNHGEKAGEYFHLKLSEPREREEKQAAPEETAPKMPWE
jgi:hypothetical protein